jgi:hypothetical protein
MYLASNPVGRRRKQLEIATKNEYLKDKMEIHSMVLNHLMARI